MPTGGTGFPQLARHIAAIKRKPAAHSGYRKFHASDVVYEALRRGVKLVAPKGAEGPPSASQATLKKSGPMKSNRVIKTLMRRPK